MSDKPKFPHFDAMKVADELVARLRPFTERIEVAGSLRRLKREVGDVEILFCPRMETRQADFFSTAPFDPAAEEIGKMLADGTLAKRPSSVGTFTWAALNKLAIHNASGIPVDLFCTTEENWWNSIVIRTGSKETNIKLTTGAIRLGRRLNAYGCGVTCSDGTVIKSESERHVFELCGEKFLLPEYR